MEEEISQAASDVEALKSKLEEMDVNAEGVAQQLNKTDDCTQKATVELTKVVENTLRHVCTDS